ncbi:S8 family serine peptidase [Kocuria rhizophila]|nr:S8 family serine peptidase [Kocuria rhizophila]
MTASEHDTPGRHRPVAGVPDTRRLDTRHRRDHPRSTDGGTRRGDPADMTGRSERAGALGGGAGGALLLLGSHARSRAGPGPAVPRQHRPSRLETPASPRPPAGKPRWTRGGHQQPEQPAGRLRVRDAWKQSRQGREDRGDRRAAGRWPPGPRRRRAAGCGRAGRPVDRQQGRRRAPARNPPPSSRRTWLTGPRNENGPGHQEGILGGSRRGDPARSPCGRQRAARCQGRQRTPPRPSGWAVDHGADVINMSVGSDSTSWPQSWDSAFAYAEEKDALVVAAAGKGAPD